MKSIRLLDGNFLQRQPRAQRAHAESLDLTPGGRGVIRVAEVLDGAHVPRMLTAIRPTYRLDAAAGK